MCYLSARNAERGAKCPPDAGVLLDVRHGRGDHRPLAVGEPRIYCVDQDTVGPVVSTIHTLDISTYRRIYFELLR